MHSPLNTPHAVPHSSATTKPSATVPRLSVLPTCSITCAAATPENTSTEPMDRSNPPATMM